MVFTRFGGPGTASATGQAQRPLLDRHTHTRAHGLDNPQDYVHYVGYEPVLVVFKGVRLWRRKDGFHGSTGLAGRRVSGAASQNYRESNHGKTGKGRPVLGTAPGHVGAAKSRWFRSNIMVVLNRFMVLSIHGSFPVGGPRKKQRPLLDRHTHTRGGTV